MREKIITIILIIIATTSLSYWRLFSAISIFEDGRQAFFQIASGDTLDAVAQRLRNNSLIRSQLAFTLLARIKDADTKIRPGRYRLSRIMNAREVLSLLTAETHGQIAVTIPEGLRIRDIDVRLSEKGLIAAGEFITASTNSEGFLFPDTYFVYDFNFDPSDLISKMRANFANKITPELLAAIEKQKKTLPEIITMASILEKEVKTQQDYPIVAGILWKRLKAGWPLQTDAALLYEKSDTILETQDFSSASRYNLYKNKGLPPTPIGNPGMATIRGAIFPEESPYWFYLTDKNGAVHYAVSNEEHNENRRKYL